ncbi:sensor histidine kinase [Roseateles cellulosilyticus]|uniref:Histidine kinase n=1 Tax=Pelomonas cellulosilytica TaxID=2906762 RepID=A0ABS8Y4G3_9BURK|nr:histidine kinase [Pelomonas sp. P8]MCE4558103.1 histidine kinase [Pelomonas sp. P8]
MSRTAASLRDDLAQAAREEGLGWHRPAPLLAGTLVFALAAPLWRHHPAWALSLGLWVGHAVSDGLAGLLARRWPQSIGLPIAVASGAALGWAVEQALTPLAMNTEERLIRGWLHAIFGALLLCLPLLQGLRRLRALRRVEQERALLRAELQQLQAQIEPHFLFNTLATLRSFVRQGSERALPLLDAVSGLLETALERLRQHEDATLGQECQLVEHYLAIMAMRLGERLSYRVDVDAALHDLPLPPLMLQPLVENAIQHGIEPSEPGGQVWVRAERVDGRLLLRVINSGCPLKEQPPSGHGLALTNLRQRLQALHGDRASLALATGADGFTEATLSLPA